MVKLSQRVHVGAQNGNVYHEILKSTDSWKKIEEAGMKQIPGMKPFNMYHVLTKVSIFQLAYLF